MLPSQRRPFGASPVGLHETQPSSSAVGVVAVELGGAFVVVGGELFLGAEEQALARRRLRKAVFGE